MPTNATEWHELARTTGDVIVVVVLENESHDRVKVVVSDERLCRHLDFELAALDAASAFEWPFRNAVSQLLRESGALNEGAIA